MKNNRAARMEFPCGVSWTQKRGRVLVEQDSSVWRMGQTGPQPMAILEQPSSVPAFELVLGDRVGILASCNKISLDGVDDMRVFIDEPLRLLPVELGPIIRTLNAIVDHFGDVIDAPAFDVHVNPLVEGARTARFADGPRLARVGRGVKGLRRNGR